MSAPQSFIANLNQIANEAARQALDEDDRAIADLRPKASKKLQGLAVKALKAATRGYLCVRVMRVSSPLTPFEKAVELELEARGYQTFVGFDHSKKMPIARYLWASWAPPF